MSDMDALIEAAGRAGCVLLDLDWDDLDPTDRAEAESYHRTVLEAVGLPALLERVEAAERNAANAESVANSMQHFADVADRVERRNNELRADRDALAAKVARVEALADRNAVKRSSTHGPYIETVTLSQLRAALDDK